MRKNKLAHETDKDIHVTDYNRVRRGHPEHVREHWRRSPGTKL